MEIDDKFQIVRTIISKVTRVMESDIQLESLLYQDLMIDSLYAFEIKLLLEDKFEIVIDDIEILNVLTVSDVIRLINEYKVFKS